ncbi:hypothetical protein SLA2020_131670 [Shorea laevis]
MFHRLAVVLCLLVNTVARDINFTYNGFRSVDLSLDGLAEVTSNGLLKLTNDTQQQQGHAFYSFPVKLKNSTNGTAFSFTATFVLAFLSEYPTLGTHGMAFVISPSRGLPGSMATQYLGLFNDSNNGNDANRVVAVELDTMKNVEFEDIDNNHVGIDVNGLTSKVSHGAGYYVDGTGEFINLTLISGQPMQVWVEYNNLEQRMNVTLAPINVPKPKLPLLSLSRDLSPIVNDAVYIGFSASTGTVVTSHYVLGWSFMINGQAEELVISQLPKLPRRGPEQTLKYLTIGLPLISLTLVFATVSGVVYFIKTKREFADVVEDWELDYGPQRFKYKDLYVATNGFKDKGLLGSGGLGMKEFVAEIVSIGRLRHRHLVQLLGYCRRKGELLLVYDYMPNGSLDKYLYGQPNVTLNWRQRFRVIKGVASALLYLHEEWEQVVIHRDVKASNVLLDRELNGRLGDFGLARLYDHGTVPQTTHVVGTLGYLAPEHTRTRKATTSTDLFAFGAFLLEVACGRRPIEPQGETEDLILLDLVFLFWQRGEILEIRDPKLGMDFVANEVELVLKLGLLCSHSDPRARPRMRQVVQYLEGNVPLPDLSALGLAAGGLTFAHGEGFDDFVTSYPSSMDKAYTHSSSIAESLLS